MYSSDTTKTRNDNDKAACRPTAGEYQPLIDRNRCEAKAACVRVCPYDVFEIGQLTPQLRKELSLRGKLKAWAHGGQQAFVVRPEACHACNICVQACPEDAISLIERSPAEHKGSVS